MTAEVPEYDFIEDVPEQKPFKRKKGAKTTPKKEPIPKENEPVVIPNPWYEEPPEDWGLDEETKEELPPIPENPIYQKHSYERTYDTPTGDKTYTFYYYACPSDCGYWTGGSLSARGALSTLEGHIRRDHHGADK